MKFYLIRYLGKTAEELSEAERTECNTVFEAIDLLRDTIGDDQLYSALQHSFAEQIYWRDTARGQVGYAIATDMQVDPLEGE